MKTKKFLFYLLAALLGGCVPVMSLHPLFSEKDVVFDEKLLGTWVDDSNETMWHFSDANKPEKAYKLIFTEEEDKKGSFIVHLVKLKDKLFLDVYPSEPPCDEEDPNKVEWAYNILFFVPVHTFIKINAIEPQLKLQFTDDDELEKLLKENPKAVEHMTIKDTPFLTASTKKLQVFVLKYADDDRLFTGETVLLREKTGSPDKPNSAKSDEPQK